MNHTDMQPRYEVEAGINNCLLVRDTHNFDLTSLTKHALGFLERLSAQQNGRTLIVSDIQGDEMACEMFYNNIQQVIKSETVNRIIFIGSDLMAHARMFDGKIATAFYATTDAFLQSDILASFHNEAVLLKIAPPFHPECIEQRLQQLPHDTVLEINFDAMFHNIDYFRSKLHPTTKLMCMVKASAYGSGSIEVAQAMQHYGVNYLAVAFVNEGSELRRAGIELPIMVLDPMEVSLHQLFTYKLEPEVASFRFLQLMLHEAQQRGLQHYPIHIKFDTGMHRAGFTYEDLPRLGQLLNGQHALHVASAFSHLAAADEITSDMDAFTMQQFADFKQCTNKLEQILQHQFLRHILNTAGIERFSEYQFDMVRLGIGLWGMNCMNEQLLRNVCSLSTRIMQLKHLHAGDTVGYGRCGHIVRDTDIALLPIGYADGMDRRLGNGRGHVFYNGHEAPIVGNICMDLLMIDVTGMDAHEGDLVVVFDDDHRISHIAAQLGTIPYEVLTSISPRVRRVYFRR